MGIDVLRRRAVFLDRDGVLNRAILRDGRPFPPQSLQEFEILPGVKEALEILGSLGFLRIVVTNQPDVARGLQSRNTVEEIHRHLRRLLPVEDIRVCCHDDTDGCQCRKPEPGMLTAAAADWDINPRGSFLVGDRWRDIEAGRRFGCRSILIDHGYAEKAALDPDHRVQSLTEAVDWIVQQERI